PLAPRFLLFPYTTLFRSEVDRALLHDAVDVETPRVVVDQHVDGQLELRVQPLYEPPHAARRLSSALHDDAVVALPELVLVEARRSEEHTSELQSRVDLVC